MSPVYPVTYVAGLDPRPGEGDDQSESINDIWHESGLGAGASPQRLATEDIAMSVDEGAAFDELEQQIAETVGRALAERDRLMQGLGIELVAIWPGRARLAMTVREDMLNGHDVCHGGVIFALADTAFGFACNAYNQKCLTSTSTIHFAASARPGDRLTAEARERRRSDRVGVYDVSVTNRDGEMVALFRGEAYRLDDEVVPGVTVAV
jgi:acyl-CoA thioesterase